MSDDTKSSGGFFSGLLFGVAAGAAGYFFLKTEEGKKARVKLNEEWEKARGELAESGVIDSATQSLPETMQHTIQRIISPKKISNRARVVEPIDEEEVAVEEVKAKPTKKATKTVKTTKKKADSKKFKGV